MRCYQLVAPHHIIFTFVANSHLQSGGATASADAYFRTSAASVFFSVRLFFLAWGAVLLSSHQAPPAKASLAFRVWCAALGSDPGLVGSPVYAKWDDGTFALYPLNVMDEKAGA